MRSVEAMNYFKQYILMSGLHWTGVPRYARRMGYKSGQRRLAARGKRCRSQWRNHVLRCRELMVAAANRCSDRGRVLVVGSGPLHDIPVAQLSARFREVVLLDMVHLQGPRSEVKQFDNVCLVQGDVTGIVERVFVQRSLDVRPIRPWDSSFDLIISANVLSQLPLMPCQFVQASDGEKTSFARRVVRDHLNWLAKAQGRVCLIADVERQYWKGDILECAHPLLWGHTLPAGAEKWIWVLGPKPEMDPDFDIKHKVYAYVSFPKTEIDVNDTKL